MVKFVVQGESIEVEDKIKDQMAFVTEAEAIEKKDEIKLENISKKTFENILQACKTTGCEFKNVTKVKSDNPEEFIGPQMTKFFDKLTCSC